MGAKLGLSGENTFWGCLRTECREEYLAVSEAEGLHKPAKVIFFYAVSSWKGDFN
jgi:hypothetical protein